MLMNVVDGTAIRDHMPFKTPFLPQNILQKSPAGTSRFAIDPVIRAHHCFNLGLFNRVTKRRKICLSEVLLTDHRVKLMTENLRSAMNSVMLSTSRDFHILRMVSL